MRCMVPNRYDGLAIPLPVMAHSNECPLGFLVVWARQSIPVSKRAMAISVVNFLIVSRQLLTAL